MEEQVDGHKGIRARPSTFHGVHLKEKKVRHSYPLASGYVFEILKEKKSSDSQFCLLVLNRTGRESDSCILSFNNLRAPGFLSSFMDVPEGDEGIDAGFKERFHFF